MEGSFARRTTSPTTPKGEAVNQRDTIDMAALLRGHEAYRLNLTTSRDLVRLLLQRIDELETRINEVEAANITAFSKMEADQS